MDNEWNKRLLDRFSDYAVTEPEGLWEGIEQGMDGKRRRSLLPVWLFTGVAAAAAVALVLFIRPSGGETPMTEGPLASVTAADTISYPIQPEQEEMAVSAETEPIAVRSRRTLLADVPEVLPSVSPDPGGIPSSVPSSDVGPVQESTETVGTNREDVSGPSEREIWQWPDEKVDNAPNKGGVSLSVYGTGSQDAASSRTHGYGMANTGEYLTRSTDGGTGTDMGKLVRMLSANRSTTYDTRHEAPARVGLLASWQMASHLRLVSGVNWTTVVSEFEESSADMRTLVRQNLGYVGVPLRLETSFNPWKGLWLYAGAGGMVEKGVRERTETYSFIQNHQSGVQYSTVDTGGLLWSVGLEAGAEYRITPVMGIFVAPGLEYHFDNGSAVRSAYTERPVHLEVSFGLRFNFGE